jgi:hypothetical protein
MEVLKQFVYSWVRLNTISVEEDRLHPFPKYIWNFTWRFDTRIGKKIAG